MNENGKTTLFSLSARNEALLYYPNRTLAAHLLCSILYRFLSLSVYV